MAKVMITAEDIDNGSVDLGIGGDFEKDINKCSPAQKLILEALAFMLRNAKTDEPACSEKCDGCNECGNEPEQQPKSENDGDKDGTK